MRLLRAADRPAMQWKNGGGATREVAAYPPGADMNDFGWRISIADVAVAGPFSPFAGVDRILTVLEGRLSLAFDDRTVELAPDEPFAFPGDVPVYGTPMDGPVRDLNVMVRRGAWRASVTRWQPGMPLGGTRIAVATRAMPGIGALDALLLEPDDAPPTQFTGYLIRLDRTD